jgi:hypothetical protein
MKRPVVHLESEVEKLICFQYLLRAGHFYLSYGQKIPLGDSRRKKLSR